MSEGLGESLDNLVMGGGTEQVTESDEKVKARMVAAQKRIKALRKDEAKSKGFDFKLAHIIRSFTNKQIIFIGYLIDQNVASEVILALFSIVNDNAFMICKEEAKKFDAGLNKITPNDVNMEAPHTKHIDEWWRFMYWADTVAPSGFINELADKEDFLARFASELSILMREYLETHEIQDFNRKKLEKMINERGRRLFFPKK